MAKNIIAGLDVGTSNVQVVVTERREGGLRVLGCGSAPTVGIRKGAVVDIEDVAESIRAAVVAAEKNAGVPFDSVYLSFGGCGLGVASSKGVVAVSRADNEITDADIARAVSAAEASLPQQPNRELLHEIPVLFTVDKDTHVKNPVGMVGSRLEAQVIFVTAFTPHLKNLVRSVELAGLSVDDITAAPLALARSILTKRQKEIGVMVMDLGSETASVAVFEDGGLVSAGVFPIGSGHITNDIAIGFQSPLPIAERIKIDHGTLSVQLAASRKDIVRLGEYVQGDPTLFSRRELMEIIEARLKDIYGLVDKHLRKIGRSGLLPAGVVLVGGGSNLEGIIDFTKHELRLPAELGALPVSFREDAQQLDASWAVVTGLCLLANESEKKKSYVPNMSHDFFKKIMNWVRPLIP